MPRINSEKFYNSAIDKHGITPKGVNWTSLQNQHIRFQTILKFLPKNISTLIDAGCGFGDFYLYAQNEPITINKYIGIDSLSSMCAIAREKTEQTILQADITIDTLPLATFYICSGAMNILNPYETHTFIRSCFKASSVGFIFNILHGDKQSTTYNYLTKQKIQNIAKLLHVKRVEFEENYMNNDITVAFFHV